MNQFKARLFVFFGSFLLSVVCGALLHNLFTSERLKTLAESFLAAQAPQVTWRLSGVEVTLADGFIPTVALKASRLEVTGNNTTCSERLDLEINNLVVPLKLSSLMRGPIALAVIRFQELYAREVPRMIQNCTGFESPLPKEFQKIVRIVDGEFEVFNNKTEFGFVLPVDQWDLLKSVVVPIEVSGQIDGTHLLGEVRWREGVVTTQLELASGNVNFEINRFPVGEAYRIFLKFVDKRDISDVGANWLDANGDYTKSEKRELKFDKFEVSGDIGKLSLSDLKLNFKPSLQLFPFKVDVQTLHVDALLKATGQTLLPRFFKTLGHVYGIVNFEDHAHINAKVNWTGAEFEVARQGKKTWQKIKEIPLNFKSSHQQWEIATEKINLEKGEFEGSVKIKGDGHKAHANFIFDKITLNSDELLNLTMSKWLNTKASGEFDFENGLIQKLNAKGTLSDFEGPGLRSSEVRVTVQHVNPRTVFEITSDEVHVEPKLLSDKYMKVLESLNDALITLQTGLWKGLKLVVESEKSDRWIRSMAFYNLGTSKTGDFILGVLEPQPDKAAGEVRSVTDKRIKFVNTKSRKVIGIWSAELGH